MRRRSKTNVDFDDRNRMAEARAEVAVKASTAAKAGVASASVGSLTMIPSGGWSRMIAAVADAFTQLSIPFLPSIPWPRVSWLEVPDVLRFFRGLSLGLPALLGDFNFSWSFGSVRVDSFRLKFWLAVLVSLFFPLVASMVGKYRTSADQAFLAVIVFDTLSMITMK